MLDLTAYLDDRRQRVEAALADGFPEEAAAEILSQAVRYSLFVGGKRLRPILCLAAAEAVGAGPEAVMPAACALECIHTYSLIHDDLPAMDDDDLRRGKPTNHKVYGEATAILAGDVLLTEAFRLLAEPAVGVDAARRLRVIRDIAAAAGMNGMIRGQALDLAAEGRAVSLEDLREIHRRKTGDLLAVSVTAGAILAGATDDQVAALDRYGRAVGLAFQIADDILDVVGQTARLGKNTGSDAARGKATFPALLGLDASREALKACVSEALAALSAFDDQAEPLRAIARYISEREI